MEQTVEALCNQMARNHLLPTDNIRDMRQRWRSEHHAAPDNVKKFGKWITANGFITEFQLGFLNRGFGEYLSFDKYVLVEKIGRGRMAGVYKAVHECGQEVAIKVLPPTKAQNAHTLARFQREARLALRLNHPNVVRTFQQAKTNGGIYYIVMEFLEGEALDDHIKRRKKLPVSEAVQIIVQTLNGLQHLFEEAVVHRDMKPANLMSVPVPQENTLNSTVKILDIGLGRALFDEGDPGAENLDLTGERALLGTPKYMSPEQARNAHSADIRSDIYSVGCIFYELLTGKAPFADSSIVRQLTRHAKEPPRPVRELASNIPEGVEHVVEIMLAKDPAQRYSTPAQAAKALKGTLGTTLKLPPVKQPSQKMKTYLDWLKQEEVKPKPPIREPQSNSSEPAVAQPAAPLAKRIYTALTLGPAAVAIPVNPNPPKAVPVAATPGGQGIDPFPGPVGEWLAQKGIKRRDLISGGIGAGLLLGLQCIWWFFSWLVNS